MSSIKDIKDIKNNNIFIYFIYVLIIFSVIWCGIGGYLDITEKDKMEMTLFGMKMTPSKFHFWYDAIFVLVLCITLILLRKL